MRRDYFPECRFNLYLPDHNRLRMKEDLLQYIWKFRYYNNHELKTVEGDSLKILYQGKQNFDQGPDFLDARIQINDTVWVGNVELHVFSKQWNQHNHQKDVNYKNVILHVVWEHDEDVYDINGQILPTFELKSRVAKLLLERYRQLLDNEKKQNGFFIACEKFLDQVPEIKWTAWKSRLSAERLEYKTKKVFEILGQTRVHWDETMWRMTASNFGGKINGEIFQKIAETIPQKILARHKDQQITIEAMLLGQADQLNENFVGKYPLLLQKEYRFYKKKYDLTEVDGSLFFGRMRPANFPTIRLAQLSSLIIKSNHLFSYVKDLDNVKELFELLKVSPNDYWLYHYRLDDESSEEKKEKTLGRQMMENMIINTICPIMFAYGVYNRDESFKEKALNWLEGLSPEKNKITRGFESLNVKNENASDSQALIHLKNNYCDEKRCLECTIGNAILRKTVQD